MSKYDSLAHTNHKSRQLCSCGTRKLLDTNKITGKVFLYCPRCELQKADGTLFDYEEVLKSRK